MYINDVIGYIFLHYNILFVKLGLHDMDNVITKVS